MHRKHLLPGFDDQTSDERAIERLTEDITSVGLSSSFCTVRRVIPNIYIHQ